MLCGRSLTLLLSSLLCFLIFQSPCSSGADALNQSQPLLLNQTLVSPRQIFELGFFFPGNSRRLYLGLWHKNVAERRFMWVANRERPLAANDSGSSLKIGPDGNLRLEDGNQTAVWSTNVTVQSSDTVAVLTDEGNFILRNAPSGLTVWQSFDHPGDTLLPGMTLFNSSTGQARFLSSWKAEDDPSPGRFTSGPTVEQPPQFVTWINGSTPYWRSGPWNGLEFLGVVFNVPGYDAQGYALGINIRPGQDGTVYFEYSTHSESDVTIITLTPSGSLALMSWSEQTNQWIVSMNATENPCDHFGTCGPFGLCNRQESLICQCFQGFVPRSNEEWSRGNWRSGCVRRTQLLCQRNESNITEDGSENDGFQVVREMKLPAQFTYIFDVRDVKSCEERCLSNCSCAAYAYLNATGCLIWSGELIDSHQIPNEGEGEFFIRLAASEIDTPGENNAKKIALIISLTTVAIVLVLLAIFLYWFRRQKAIRRGRKKTSEKYSVLGEAISPRNASELQISEDHKFVTSSAELLIIDFDKIVSATDNFSLANKLGEGGFGPVYKGKMANGQDIAVKRLSSHSGQGIEEFKNEILLISKLQHRNLVKLLGCCIHGDEKLLVYEYMKNRSLDAFIFDSTRKLELDWTKRFHIIQGIARGILYLHRDSRLRIIHRDLKASNVLLDDDLNPKISDFGLARTFKVTEEQVNTQRVVGTFGYMSPEYAIWGLFSDKSDVYSFGILLLEIVSGRKNTGFIDDNYVSLLGYAWKLWDEEAGLDLMDQSLANSSSPLDVMRCIHIGLLCIQDQPVDRPTMSDIVNMLSSEIDLSRPKQPTFTLKNWLDSISGGYSPNTFSVPNTFSLDTDNISLIESGQ